MGLGGERSREREEGGAGWGSGVERRDKAKREIIAKEKYTKQNKN